MNKSKDNFQEIEKINLDNDLNIIEKEINLLKKLYEKIDNQTEELINLLKLKFNLHLKIIENSKPGTEYQKTLYELVNKKYILNPEFNETGILKEIKSFFKEIPAWIINDDKKYINEQKKYNEERQKTKEFQLDEIEEKIKEILDIERRNVSVSNEQLKFFGLNETDRPDFEKCNNFYYKTYYGDTYIKPKGCTLKGELIISETDYQKYKEDIFKIQNELNSSEFKSYLVLNFNKLKKIIKEVCLNILLGKRNKIKDRQNKILNRERSIERIKKQKNVEGFIYILTNKSFPNYLKIGSTMKNPKIRAEELSGTGLPFPFEVKFKKLTKNCEILEKKVHSILDKKRVDLEREFFNCSVDEAVKVIEKVVRDA